MVVQNRARIHVIYGDLESLWEWCQINSDESSANLKYFRKKMSSKNASVRI